MLVEITIGFVEPSYIVTESGGQQEVCAEIKSGILRTTVAVQFSTANGDAVGMSALISYDIVSKLSCSFL